MLPLTRFVTDASLDRLARRMRFLGYDIVTHRGARLEELFAVAASEGRTVLTLSDRRPPRGSDVAVLQVPRNDDAAALRAIAAAHAPASAPWSRCPGCNVALHTRSTFEARGEVPGRVTRTATRLTWCPACGRWYWPGSHVARMNAWFEGVLGAPIAPSAPPATGTTERSDEGGGGSGGGAGPGSGPTR
ncbi:MAG: Mut7-C RNAse domain-containing protein [bacterium]